MKVDRHTIYFIMTVLLSPRTTTTNRLILLILTLRGKALLKLGELRIKSRIIINPSESFGIELHNQQDIIVDVLHNSSYQLRSRSTPCLSLSLQLLILKGSKQKAYKLSAIATIRKATTPLKYSVIHQGGHPGSLNSNKKKE